MNHDLGDVVELTYDHYAGGLLASADTATWTITLPDGTTTSVPATAATPGRYRDPFATTQVGQHIALWEGTGANAGAYETAFTVTGRMESWPAAGQSYATLADLAEYLGEQPPDGAGRLLVKASRRLDHYLIGAWYPTENDMPTEPAHQAAFRSAVCAQIEWWIETGDLTGTGASAGWRSVSIGSLSMSRSGNGTSTTSDLGAGGSASGLAPEAVEILHLAGLTPVSPWVWG